MGLVIDIVPNHMAAVFENPWWRDVLRRGPDSPFAPFFDIDWHPGRPELENKVLLPIPAQSFGRVLENGEITLVPSGDGMVVRHGEHLLPLGPGTPDGRAGDPGPEGLEEILDAQAYRRAWWRTGSRALNYRRFFDVTGLVSLKVEEESGLLLSKEAPDRWRDIFTGEDVDTGNDHVIPLTGVFASFPVALLTTGES